MIAPARHDVPVQPLAAQVEEAVGEPRLLRIVLIAEDRQRQLGRRAEHLDLGDVDLDLAGRQIRVLRARRAAGAPCRRCAPPIRSAPSRPRAKAGESGSATHCVMP